MITNKVLFVTFLLALAIVMFAVNVRAAEPPQLPPNVTCNDIRQHVRNYGYWPALLWAKANGFRPSEIEAAKRCLKQ